MAHIDDDEFEELFNDAASEGDFEGFNLEDLENDQDRQHIQEFSESNWTVSDHERSNLVFRSAAGLNQPALDALPENASPLDFFRLFFFDSDFLKNGRRD